MSEKSFLEELEPDQVTDAEAESTDTDAEPTGEEQAPTPGGDAKAAASTDETGGDQEAEQTEQGAPEKGSEEYAQWAAVRDEREKRRKANEEAAYWKGRAEALADGDPKNQEIDPEEEKAKALKLEEEYLLDPVGKAREIAAEAAKEAALQTRVSLSTVQMKREVEDFDEVETKFIEMAKNNPALLNQAAASAEPARWAYEHVKQAERLNEHGGNFDAAVAAEVEKKAAALKEELTVQLRKEMGLADAEETQTTPAKARGSGGSAQSEAPHDWKDQFNSQSF